MNTVAVIEPETIPTGDATAAVRYASELLELWNLYLTGHYVPPIRFMAPDLRH
jgi:hypothetical protein